MKKGGEIDIDYAHYEQYRPDDIDHTYWNRFIADSVSFNERWSERAIALGWEPDELLKGETGMFWHIRGRHVVAMTQAMAVFRDPETKKLTFYKRPRGCSIPA